MNSFRDDGARSRSSKVLGSLAPVAAGLLAGVVASLLVTRASNPASLPTVAPEKPPGVALVTSSPDTHSSIESARFREMNERLAKLEAQRDESDASAMPADAPSEHRPEGESRAEGAARDWAMFSAKLRSHEQEPIDQAWAKTTSSSFGKDLAEAGRERGFQVISTDCRTASCVGVVEWPSYSCFAILDGSQLDSFAGAVVIPDRAGSAYLPLTLLAAQRTGKAELVTRVASDKRT